MGIIHMVMWFAYVLWKSSDKPSSAHLFVQIIINEVLPKTEYNHLEYRMSIRIYENSDKGLNLSITKRNMNIEHITVKSVESWAMTTGPHVVVRMVGWLESHIAHIRFACWLL
jgi:hypothetical protein